MKIAFTHNLNINDTPEEAEYDDPATVSAIVRALEGAGHTVAPIDVAGPVSALVAALEAFRPDLVFNTAEGAGGPHREAFYPALFDTMGIPYTGSDARTCMLTLDKAWTKTVLLENGIPTPAFALATSVNGAASGLKFPVILKPNCEGSSKGINDDSVVRDPARLERRLDAMLRDFPGGVLVEEFIEGADVAVPYIAGVGPEVLDVIAYHYGADPGGNDIYSYELKHGLDGAVSVSVPANIPAQLADSLKSWTAQAVRALGIRDICRLDFRISASGAPNFIEINALPSLQPNAGLFDCARLHGLDFDAVIVAVVESAAKRHGLTVREGRPAGPAAGLAVGLAFNMKRVGADVDDSEAEYDSPATIAGVTAAIESHGHRVVPLEANAGLPALMSRVKVDLVFNMAEGARGRSRESQVPALCDLLGVEHTGADAAALVIALDKALAKKIFADKGIPTPAYFMMETGAEPAPPGVKYPLIIKPNFEGTSKGIGPDSVVDDEAALRKTAAAMIEKYDQPVVVEEYIEGREISVALVGWPVPRALPAMEVVFRDPGPRPVYSYELKQDWEGKLRYEIPAKLNERERAACEQAALKSFSALGCRDVARVDIRLSREGVPYVLEVNPLPGLGPEFSDLPKIAYATGMTYNELIGEILAGAAARLARAKARG